MVRRRVNRNTKKTAYIFCEGKTEQFYFEGFKKDSSNNFSIKLILLSDKTPDKLVKFTKEYLKRKSSYDNFSDLVFCVFDRDDNTNESMIKAKQIATHENYNLIFSNPSFEYWLLCHYGEFNQSYENCDDVISKLSNYINPYTKTDVEIYEKTKDNILTAIRIAKKIEEKHKKNNVEIISKNSNPTTKVYEIIESLK